VALIDGTVNACVTHAVLFPIDFACGYLCVPEFFMTKLESTYPVVLRHNWSVEYNPNINWKTGTLQFPALKNHDTALTSEALPRATSETTQEQSLSLKGRAAHLTEKTPNLIDVSLKYQQFADIFCKSKFKLLPEHHLFNLAIQRKDGATPPLRPIYSLSHLELQTLQEFIKENTKTGIIRPLNSPCGASVLFVKKKNGSLCLCMDYRGLNRITQKDRYPILLVSDLLNAPRKAWIYLKIDLRSAYHLVHIV